MSLKICLLGSLPKGDEARKNWTDWKIDYKNRLSVMPDIEFTDGDAWTDESRPFELVGHDSYIIKTADLIIVNAENKLGAGTAQEMIIAKYFKKPVITILPKDTHHRKSKIVFNGELIDDWIHPFILTFSDLLVEDLTDCIGWIKELNKGTELKIKDITTVDQAVNSFLKFTGRN
ncbi:MAG: hypothetical protein PHC53_04710 [Patescibacteria group bacterium]|nr:hypothetical protein [Patescibacteria group bacterium]